MTKMPTKPDQVGPETGQDRNADGQGATTERNIEPTDGKKDSENKGKESETKLGVTPEGLNLQLVPLLKKKLKN